jgi:hypothetical protein
MVFLISSSERMLSLAGASEASSVESQLTFAGNIPRQSIHRCFTESMSLNGPSIVSCSKFS